MSVESVHTDAREVGRGGLFGVGVPVSMGGTGGDVADLLELAARVAEASPPAAVRLVSQRLLIEVLLRGENVGLREHQLPALLRGDIGGNCTGCWPQDAATPPPIARDTGRGWRATGALPAVPNLAPDGFVVSAPIRFQGAEPPCLVLLRAEDDGLHRRPVAGAEAPDLAALDLQDVFLREDEIIWRDAGQATRAMAPLALGLVTALFAGACRRRLASAGGDRAMHRKAVDEQLLKAADAVRLGVHDPSPRLRLQAQMQTLTPLPDPSVP